MWFWAWMLACPPAADTDTGEGTPLDLPLLEDGVTYAGAAVVDITPVITETFTDLNDNHDFDGCLDDPDASEEGCDEPFDDADGDGWFDAVFIGGFGPLRPANEVHDPIECRAVVIASGGEYVAFVGLDLVGLGSPRIYEAKEALAVDGFDPDHLFVASTHNHQGPDTMGLWGDPYDLAAPVSGLDLAYQEQVAQAIEQAVRDAAADIQPVDLKVGAVNLRDVSPYYSGATFGGKNPTAKMHGLVYDGRDPVVVSDQLLVMQGTSPETGDVVFTYTNWSGHPEVRASANNALSSDWVGVTRQVLEQVYGGVAVHMPESLGGMQSALNGDVPLIDEDGNWVWTDELDEDGDPVPEYAERNSWDFVHSHGWIIADAAIGVLEEAQVYEAPAIQVDGEDMYLPIDNLVFQLLGPHDVFELGWDDAVEDSELCPEAAESSAHPGCLLTRAFRVQLGPITFLTVPGELLPELFWGFPDHADWDGEASDVAQRGSGATFFPQHDPDCDEVGWEACSEDGSIGECNCLSVHAWPYALNDDDAVPPLVDTVDTEFAAVLGMTDSYFSYVIPEPDFNTWVSLLVDDGDHYEDTVSISPHFGTRWQEAQLAIHERWETAE